MDDSDIWEIWEGFAPRTQRTLWAIRIQGFLNSLPILPLTDLPEGDKNCHVCIEPFQEAPDAEKAVRLPCRHILGKSCLEKWLKSSVLSNTCPMCRAVLFERYRPSLRAESVGDDTSVRFEEPPQTEPVEDDFAQRRNRRTSLHSDLIRRVVAQYRRNTEMIYEEQIRLQARANALRDRAAEPALSLLDQEASRQTNREHRHARFSERLPRGQVRDRRAWQEERDTRAELLRSTVRTHINRVDNLLQTYRYRDRENIPISPLLEEHECRMATMLLEQGLGLERMCTEDLMPSNPTDPLIRRLRLQNQALSPFRDRLVRAGTRRRRAHDDMEDMSERQRLGMPPPRPTMARAEASGGRPDRPITNQQRLDTVNAVSEDGDRPNSAASDLEGRDQSDAATRAASRRSGGARAMRFRAAHVIRTRDRIHRTIATERLNLIDASSNVSTNQNERPPGMDESPLGSRLPATERLHRPVPTLPFSTSIPSAANVNQPQTPTRLNATPARAQEPAPRPGPQPQPQPQARPAPPQRPNSALRYILPILEARTQQQQQQQQRPMETTPALDTPAQTQIRLPYILPRFDARSTWAAGRNLPYTSLADASLTGAMGPHFATLPTYQTNAC